MKNVGKDLYRDDCLRADCPFCMSWHSFLVCIINGHWRCEWPSCRAQGQLKDFGDRLGISRSPTAQCPPKLERPTESQPVQEEKQSLAPALSRPPSITPVPGKRLLSKTVQKRQIKKLSSRHHEIIERLLLGHRSKDIAREMHIGSQ